MKFVLSFYSLSSFDLFPFDLLMLPSFLLKILFLIPFPWDARNSTLFSAVIYGLYLTQIPPTASLAYLANPSIGMLPCL